MAWDPEVASQRRAIEDLAENVLRRPCADRAPSAEDQRRWLHKVEHEVRALYASLGDSGHDPLVAEGVRGIAALLADPAAARVYPAGPR